MLGDEAAVALNQFRATAMIGADDGAHVLGVELGRQSGRAHKVAEHDGELASLGFGERDVLFWSQRTDV